MDGSDDTNNPADTGFPSETSSGSELHQPHDKLFKSTFGVEENTAALLREKLPAELAKIIDWTSLRREPGTFVAPSFQQSHTDLLFTTNLNGRQTYLYVLFEHQSTRDPRIALRLLHYMLSIWFKLEAQFPWPNPLPPILPVVLSQNDVLWDVPERLAELIDIPTGLEDALRPIIPDFSFQHIQLSEMDYEAIPGTKTGIFVLRVMKAQRAGQLLADPIWDESLIMGASPRVLEMVLRYILGNDVDKAGFEDRIKAIRNPEIRRKAMTLAQVYHQEGRQEGQLDSRRQDVIEALELRFGTIPVGLHEAVSAVSDPEKLRLLLRSAIVSPTIEEFSAIL